MNNSRPTCGKIDVRGLSFDNVNFDEALALCLDYVHNPKDDDSSAVLHTPNSEILQLCIEHNEYYEIMGSADVIIPDGVGVILASRLLGTPLKKGKVAGVEIAEGLLRTAASEGLRVFFYGGKPAADGRPSVAEAAAANMKAKYPDLCICGTLDGYIKDEAAVISRIHDSGADILFVCLGVPKQEEFMYRNKSRLGTKLCCGFGGSLDIFAGTAKRAPKIFIKLGLEWLYRLINEPSRFFRMLSLPKFLFGTAVYRLSGKSKKK